ALPPFAGSRHDLDIFAELADRLGFGDRYTEGRDELGWLAHMYEGARRRARELGYALPRFDEFWQAGSYEFPAPAVCESFPGAFRPDPDANPLSTPPGKTEIFPETIAWFSYDDCPPHPSWLEPAEWLGGERAATFPLHLLSNQPSVRLHSQLDPSPMSK